MLKQQKHPLYPFVVLTAVLALAPSWAFSKALNVDPDHSEISFSVKHLKFIDVRGLFKDYSGQIELDEKNFEKSKVNFTVQVGSVDTQNKKRDEHLKNKDFFEVEKFPTATFVSSSIQSVKKGTANSPAVYKMEGDLTLHGVTRKTSFTLTSFGTEKDPWGNTKHLFQAETELPRKEFGIVYNAPLETGGVLIGEKVKLSVNLQAK